MNNHRVETEIRPPVAQGPDIPQRAALFLAGRWPLVVLLLLALYPISVFSAMISPTFMTIKPQILDNPYVHNFQHLREVLTLPLWSTLGAQPLASYYRPVATIGFLLCYQLFGPSAWGFHLVSLLLNAAVVGILFMLAESTARGPPCGLCRRRPLCASSCPCGSRGLDFRQQPT